MLLVPHSNCAFVELELGVTIAFNVAELWPTDVATFVVARGGPARISPPHFQIVPRSPTAQPYIEEQNEMSRIVVVVSGVVRGDQVKPASDDTPDLPRDPRKTAVLGVAKSTLAGPFTPVTIAELQVNPPSVV